MKPPRLRGEIERRLLVNYRVDPDVAQRLLPEPFRPQLHRGHAIAGICLIRLGSMRPAGLPAALGTSSENAAHRFAVEWDDQAGGVRTGVYIPRRDSDSWLNVALGGRVFPGEHHRATFDVEESPDHVNVGFAANDGSVRVSVQATPAAGLDSSVVFESLAQASRFFEDGSLGYSATRTPGAFDGLQLLTDAWRVSPVQAQATSSYFDDEKNFPTGSAVLDHALLMQRVPVDWQATDRLRATS